ncbi:hypothetical protein EVAR_97458_1 [Eumeta japonica]|uniref:Secreted protein n=1 Tax=Eumeta variegata TaxID=151549 RepID=A0A4C1X143_EUMVA|nr:hypothetical protein EVAR_97458_1 [Eumeta japonica]
MTCYSAVMERLHVMLLCELFMLLTKICAPGARPRAPAAGGGHLASFINANGLTNRTPTIKIAFTLKKENVINDGSERAQADDVARNPPRAHATGPPPLFCMKF